MLLSNLQLETSALVKNLEKSRKMEEQDHQRDLMTLADRVRLNLKEVYWLSNQNILLLFQSVLNMIMKKE